MNTSKIAANADSNEMTENSIIGTAIGYDDAQIHNFLLTLESVQFGGKLFLIVDVNRVPPPKYNLDLRLVRVRASGGENVSKNPTIQRYFWIKELFKVQSFKGNILLTDVRDVVFQSNPFTSAHLGQANVLFTLEERSIGSCRYNSHWILARYGAGILRDLKGHIISCSGTTLGTVKGIALYVDKMCDHLTDAPDILGIDQGVHNYIVYKDSIADQRVLLNGLSFVATMHYMHAISIIHGKVQNMDGLITPILHQYDRLKSDVQQRINAICRS